MNRIILSLGAATLMAISIASASAKDKLSEAFLKKAIEGNFAKVSMGDHLAQKNGQSDGVKSYGKMLRRRQPEGFGFCQGVGNEPTNRT